MTRASHRMQNIMTYTSVYFSAAVTVNLCSWIGWEGNKPCDGSF